MELDFSFCSSFDAGIAALYLVVLVIVGRACRPPEERLPTHFARQYLALRRTARGWAVSGGQTAEARSSSPSGSTRPSNDDHSQSQADGDRWGAIYSIRSERLLMERLEDEVLFRWFRLLQPPAKLEERSCSGP